MSSLQRALDMAATRAMPLAVALHAERLPDVAAGQRRLVCAANGMFVEAASRALRACAKLSEFTTPYGPYRGGLHLVNGPIPRALLDEFTAQARANASTEVAAIIETFDGGYRLRYLTPHSADAGHIRYDDGQVNDETLVVDLHSHGRGAAFFSCTDDESDLSRRGPYIAVVVGTCHRVAPTTVFRLVLPPHLMPLSISDLASQGVFA